MFACAFPLLLARPFLAGTIRTSRDVRFLAATRGIADIKRSRPGWRQLWGLEAVPPLRRARAMPRLIKLCRVDRRCGAFAISSAAVWSRWEKTVCPRRFNVMKARKVGGVGAILTMWQPDGSVKTESTKSRYTTSSECGCCMVSRPRRTPQRVTLVPSRRTYRRREVTREVAKLSADSHRRRAASTMLSPVPGLAALLRRVPCFRTAFLLLATFAKRRFDFLAAIAAAPCCTFPPHSSVRPGAGQSTRGSFPSGVAE